jgi:hypothetical protein
VTTLDDAEPEQEAGLPGAPAPGGGPVLPEQSREDTDAAWGEYPESAAERFNRDRPPHWDDY